MLRIIPPLNQESLLYRITSPSELKNLSLQELQLLCDEIRQFIIENVSKTGGHFASNLGSVELITALHYVFNSPEDKFVFDVGHQAYTHKILTGRVKYFKTLRQKGGISGFPRREESVHDIVSAGHGSVSLSAGLGILKGEELQDYKNKVVCIIGDGSIGGGTAFEALNHAGQLNNNLIIILNDNTMSIDKNVGALHNYLSNRTAAKPYQEVRKRIERFFDRMPLGLGKRCYNFGVRCKKALKGFFFHETLFSDLGFEYAGPIDGHNLKEMFKAFKNAAEINRPTVIHVITRKGKGYDNAENSPHIYHGVAAFKIEHGINTNNEKTFTKVFSESLVALAKRNKKIVAVTAAMSEGTGLSLFKENFPERFFDTGMAEGHAVTFTGGLAISGMKPVTAIYSTFMQRSVDHFIHDIALQNINAVIAMDRAGLVPSDGATHQGIFDIALFKGIPNSYFLAPATGNELKIMLEWALRQRKPVLIRYPKATLPPEEPGCEESISLGRGVFVRKNKNSEILLIAVGSMLSPVLDAADSLSAKNISTDVYNLRFINPLDESALMNDFKYYKAIVLAEEGIKTGGIGETVNMLLQTRRNPAAFLHIAVPNQFFNQGSRADLLKMTGLDPASLVKKIQKFLQEFRIRHRAEQLKNNDFTLR
jgi:1-deoxy-D-xylulose-5-phosphate synthase